MSNTLPQLSNNLSPQLEAILIKVKDAADEVGVSIILVGATARDLLLIQYKLPLPTATKDLDFGVAVKDWEEYEKLKSILTETKNFRQDLKIEHRLYENHTQIPIDLVPFGEIESPPGIVRWASDFEFDTKGFQDVFNSCAEIVLNGGNKIKTLSTKGLMLLKVISWNDRGINRNIKKDVPDIWMILQNYLDMGNDDRIYTEHIDILEDEDFDYQLGGARLLGRDLATSFVGDTISFVSEIFDDRKKIERLTQDIDRFKNGIESDYETINKVLLSFRKGIKDVSH